MMADIYSSLAPFYDEFNGEIDYSAWADFIEKEATSAYNGKIEYILDLGCGTGRMTREFARRGYDMIGVDISPEMLCVAKSTAEKEKTDNILWLCQDISAFELYGTVELAVCCLDGINHLTDEESVFKCFSLVHNYLVPDGIFIFDMNTPYKFRNIYSDRAYILETDTALCAWQNDFCEDDGICGFYISLFEKRKDGTYIRTDSEDEEKMYELDTIKRLLSDSGMELLAVYSDIKQSGINDRSERWHIVARAKKHNQIKYDKP